MLNQAWDRVYVTTLFTFEWKRTASAIDFAIRAAGDQPERVFVGGIAVSLMHDAFLNEPRWAGVRFIKGLLDAAPAVSLALSADDYDFGADDLTGVPIEELVPDYGILEHIDYAYPVHDAYFGYASRGCIRSCSFCGVPKLEGAQREMPPLSNLVEGVRKRYGDKKDLVLMDNNITAAARYKEVIAEIRDLGFTPGAKLSRDGKQPVKRRVDFNQGVDARILAQSSMFLREMSTICISPLRIAFDHIGVRKVYEKSIRMAADNQITSLSNYMLYNFMDTPKDLYQRMRLNIDLNEELGIRIWSFPMRYQPVTLKDRSHVGEKVESLLPPLVPAYAAGNQGSRERQSVIFPASLWRESRGVRATTQSCHTPSFSIESISRMERVERRGRSTSRCARDSRSRRRRSSGVYLRIRPMGMEWVRGSLCSWRMTKRSTSESDS